MQNKILLCYRQSAFILKEGRHFLSKNIPWKRHARQHPNREAVITTVITAPMPAMKASRLTACHLN
jgi:hypothetical protein